MSEWYSYKSTHEDSSLVSFSVSDMDIKAVFAALETVCEENIAALCGPDLPYGRVANRLVTCMTEIQEHSIALQPVVASFTAIYHHYDFDAQTPGNGYRTLVKVQLISFNIVPHNENSTI